MKKINIIFLLSLALLAVSCDDTEQDRILPDSFSYISFESSQIAVLEEDTNFSALFTLSSRDYSNERTFTYTVSQPTDLPVAVEGVDFTLPSDSGIIVLPAGESSVDVELLNIINNNDAVGTRYVQIQLDEVSGLNLGSPADANGGTLTVAINEDDLFVFGETSFEDVPVTVGDFLYTIFGVEDWVNFQTIIPSATDPFVDWDTNGNEMGFNTSGDPSNLPSANDPEAVGVVSNDNMDTNVPNGPGDNSTVNFYTRFNNGTQGYVSSDLDGTIIIEFDQLDLPDTASDLVIDMEWYMGGTFETNTTSTSEGMELFWETADGLGDPLLSEIGNPGARTGQWYNERYVIPEDRIEDGRVVITMKNTFGNEVIFVDYVGVKGLQ